MVRQIIKMGSASLKKSAQFMAIRKQREEERKGQGLNIPLLACPQ
jgi:hypothetical protein